MKFTFLPNNVTVNFWYISGESFGTSTSIIIHITDSIVTWLNYFKIQNNLMNELVFNLCEWMNEWVCEQMDEIGEWLIEWMSSEFLR